MKRRRKERRLTRTACRGFFFPSFCSSSRSLHRWNLDPNFVKASRVLSRLSKQDIFSLSFHTFLAGWLRNLSASLASLLTLEPGSIGSQNSRSARTLLTAERFRGSLYGIPSQKGKGPAVKMGLRDRNNLEPTTAASTMLSLTYAQDPLVLRSNLCVNHCCRMRLFNNDNESAENEALINEPFGKGASARAFMSRHRRQL